MPIFGGLVAGWYTVFPKFLWYLFVWQWRSVTRFDCLSARYRPVGPGTGGCTMFPTWLSYSLVFLVLFSVSSSLVIAVPCQFSRCRISLVSAPVSIHGVPLPMFQWFAFVFLAPISVPQWTVVLPSLCNDMKKNSFDCMLFHVLVV